MFGLTEETRVFKLEKIPEGSRLDRYLKQLTEITKGNRDKFMPFLKIIFKDCWDFLQANPNISFPQVIGLRFVSTHERYTNLEKEASKNAAEEEIAKRQSTAFVVGSKFEKTICIDMEAYIDLLKKHGTLTFITGLVETYFHELLHSAFHTQKSEQEIYDIQCLFVEEFLDIKLPEQVKSMKASDYYSKKDS